MCATNTEYIVGFAGTYELNQQVYVNKSQGYSYRYIYGYICILVYIERRRRTRWRYITVWLKLPIQFICFFLLRSITLCLYCLF